MDDVCEMIPLKNTAGIPGVDLDNAAVWFVRTVVDANLRWVLGMCSSSWRLGISWDHQSVGFKVFQVEEGVCFAKFRSGLQGNFGEVAVNYVAMFCGKFEAVMVRKRTSG